MVDLYWDVDTRKPNGDRLEGAIQPPTYPNPVDSYVNAHPIDWAYKRARVPSVFLVGAELLPSASLLPSPSGGLRYV